jgi:hypothetical protein
LFKTPILFLIYNRLSISVKAFSSIAKIKPKYLYLAADGPKDEVDRSLCFKTRDKIKSLIDWDCDLKTLERKENIGCKSAVIGAIDWLFENEDRGIIVEDDCDASEDFFRFCKEMLEVHKNEEKVMHISGENPLDRKVGDASYYFSPIEHCWGWATWKRAWDHFDPDMENFPAFKANKSLKQIFDRKKDIFYWNKIFDDIYSDRLNSSWAYIWTFSIFQKSGVCITPNYNMISNLGFGNEATHSKIYDKNLANRKFENLGKISHPKSISLHNDVTNEIMDERFRFVSGMELITLHRRASEIKSKGDLEGARMIFNFVISFTEDQQLLSSALFHLGDIHRIEGKNNKALKFFEQCLLLNPENNDARKIVEGLSISH